MKPPILRAGEAAEKKVDRGVVEASAYLRMARRWWWLLAVAGIVAGAAAFVASSYMTPTYRASVTLLVVQQETPGIVQRSDLETSVLLANTFRRLITIRPLLEEAIEQGQFDLSVDELRERIRVEHPRESQLLEISATADQPQLARDIANTVATVFIESEEAHIASRAGIVSIVDPAVAPGAPVSPRRSLNAVLGGLLGLLACGMLLTLYESRDDTLRSPEDVRERTHLPTLGGLRSFGRVDRPEHQLHVALFPRSGAAEDYRVVRTSLSAALGQDDAGAHRHKVVLFTSPTSDEGKSTVVGNLAVMYGSAGYRVLVIDGDLRKPTLHDIFSLDNRTGVTTLLANDGRMIARSTQYVNVSLIPAGPTPANPSELLGLGSMRALLRDAREQYDLVFIDSPPALQLTDAAVLAMMVDSMVIVARGGRTRARDVRSAAQQLAGPGRFIAGVLLNGTLSAQGLGSYHRYVRVGGGSSMFPGVRSAFGKQWAERWRNRHGTDRGQDVPTIAAGSDEGADGLTLEDAPGGGQGALRGAEEGHTRPPPPSGERARRQE